uniref:hypothetical protein n=1 Tax=Gracilaria caudata TaxID=2572395 RepID=UPI001D11649D|nr:hypothetical protein LK014_pgp002 [Gracilaria caudata]UAD83658.1 hypothetical protein [Gracilaria caudata]
MQSGNLGCLYNSLPDVKQKLIQPICKNYNYNNRIQASCSIENVLKIANFLSIFYLDKSSYSNSLLDHEYLYQLDENSSVRISMFGGLLNYFDLMIFVKILHIYNKNISLKF